MSAPVAPHPSSPSVPPAPFTSEWLSKLYTTANRSDENLGRAELSRALHRITRGSAEAIVDAFRAVTPGDVHGKITSLVDLGCGRGLVLATALTKGFVWYAYGYDIDVGEVGWALERWIDPIEKQFREHRAKARVQLMNAVHFDARRDLVYRASFSPNGIDPLGEAVWIYALWTDWGDDTVRMLARRLLLEQGKYWTVFACSAPSRSRTLDLFRFAAEKVNVARGTIETDEALIEALEREYELAHQLQVRLSGSLQTHTVYFYRHRQRPRPDHGGTVVTLQEAAALFPDLM